ncbi:M57 family metalloprotease [Hymenobacter edaphi]|uniref:Protease n=1 Tax=Hymenobacter edaphi TaxID=2211146 RepID=A0A328BIH2_9BACT|nr:M57 family metalloprotease [Hymenobacter edaphi]RAK66943.1 protease [Hymenobacter edaphi]
MKKPLFTAALALAVLGLNSCGKKDDVRAADQPSEQALTQIRALGFSTHNAQKTEDGYLVEGDIVLTEADLGSTPLHQLLRVGNAEQYRTNNLVSAGPGRVIRVSISSRLPTAYVAGLDEAIRRYNAENLLITFQRVSSGADIDIVKGNGSFLASAGFPTSAGAPYGQVKVNSQAIGASPSANYLGTILAHEIGHCIGFRHTDFMDRSYSCGGATANEGASTVGAIHIPGTPTTAEPNSWMLACIGAGQSRPFDSHDKTALNYLY